MDAGVVMGQVCCNRLFLQAFHGWRDRGGIFGKSRFIASIEVLYRVSKTPESNMRPAPMRPAARRARRRGTLGQIPRGVPHPGLASLYPPSHMGPSYATLTSILDLEPS